jgi:predicted RNA-binding protein YlqC (UPF0109 family)
MQELVRYLVSCLVDEPEQIQITEVPQEAATTYEVRVAASDLGKVIGKQGRTARSMRTILGAAGMKLHKRFQLEIIEEDE